MVSSLAIMRLTDWRITSTEMMMQRPVENTHNRVTAPQVATINVSFRPSFSVSAPRLSAGEKSAQSSVKWAEDSSPDTEGGKFSFCCRDRSSTNLTCKGEEHPSGTEQVVPALSKREDHTEGAQDDEEQAEDGDGRCRDVVLWGRDGGWKEGQTVIGGNKWLKPVAASWEQLPLT